MKEFLLLFEKMIKRDSLPKKDIGMPKDKKTPFGREVSVI
jgi:hypothetical protein